MRPWDRGDIELLIREWNGGTTLEAISIKLDRTHDDIMKKAAELGLKDYESKQQDAGAE